MPDAFIWYHADANKEPELLHWLELVHQQADVRGNLFIRNDEQKTTFMETYNDVSSATIKRIEKLAATYSLFEDIHRQCESFIKIT